MKKQIIILGLCIANYAMAAAEAGVAVYKAKTYVVCTTDKEDRDNPRWYIPFERELMRLRADVPYHPLVTENYDTVTLKSSPTGQATTERIYKGEGPYMVPIPGIAARVIGEPEVQFSHKFRTTVYPELLSRGQTAVSKVCRVYYVMEPVR